MKNLFEFKLFKILKKPPLILCMSFLVVIFVGAFLLNLPIASNNNESMGFVNALFTSTSATCVTGLVVVNTAEFFSTFGKIVILFLIQIGGLGTMVLFSMLLVITGKKIGLKDRILIREQLNTDSLSGLVKFSKYVLEVSILIEIIGALFLSTVFISDFGLLRGIWFSIFHSISAFCNAGFDILGNSIVPYKTNYIINLTIMFLIILGGLGFGVYMDIYKHKKFSKLSTHSKMVLIMSGILLIVGTLLFLIIEYNNSSSIANFNLKDKILISAFQSTITRTAGFNSIDISKIFDSTAFVMIILMFIGGSPASTAGGLKTTTFGVLLFTTVSVIRGERDVVFMKRKISLSIVLKALAICIICLILVVLVALLLSIIEADRFNFIDILFETVSAFGTVGVTRGITPLLDDASKIILSMTMFLGRVGPTTLAIGFLGKNYSNGLKYAKGNIIVG
ncbi:potassium uptake protein KtrB [Peptoniphilus sp. ING2-D1G]|nr:potassium uptake protein KtrB [Peptoniphilus sp. ING2-D1G]